MRLRTYLQGLTLAAVLPLAAFAIAVAVVTLTRERESLSHGAQARALTLLTAIEAELGNSISTLDALAAMPSLAVDDLPRFRTIAEAVLKSQPDWLNIHLALPEGRQVMNLRVPQGAPLPPLNEKDADLDSVVRARKPIVGDVVMNPLVGRWTFAVRVPIVGDGVVRYILSANVTPESIGRIIEAQKLAANQAAVVVDAKARFVWRNWEPQKYLGQPASQSLRDALASGPNGWFEGRTVEGTPIFSPWWRSERHGWAVAMGIPVSEVTAAAWRVAWLLVAGLLAALVLSFLLARTFARRVSQPIAELAAATEAIGEGKPGDFRTAMPIRELRALRRALRKADRAVRERQDALHSADRAKDEFLAILGHELRNPLAALTAATHVLKVAPAGAAADKARAVLERQTRQMTRLIEDLLDISRISMGKAVVEKSVFNLAEFAEEIVAGLRSSSPNRITVSRPAAPILIEADRARIEQILSNLLDNAIKFSPAGEPIAVEVRAEDGSAVIRVADHGRGIPSGQIDRIFDLFVQGEHGPDRTKSGLGLGLALVKRLAELHGGTVTVVSEGENRGATFTVRLPSVHALAQQSPADDIRAPREQRILIVDDNEDVRETLREMLALEGHDVREASDGASGIALARKEAPDVALIDIALPDLDGYEVARRLKSAANGAHIRLIAVTGFGQPDDRRRALEAGFDAHLTKPVRLEQLTRAISGHP